MPAEKINSHNLRERSHNFTIPLIVNNMLRKNFLYRLLFRDMRKSVSAHGGRQILGQTANLTFEFESAIYRLL